MADKLINPTPMAIPFALNGDRNTLPEKHDESSSRASLDVGFPAITSIPVADGGVPPTRADFNGLGHLLTTFSYYMQNGGTFTFDPNVAYAIKGYPINARLWGTNGNGKGFVVRSLKSGNEDNFVAEPAYIGNSEGQINVVGDKTYKVSWVYDIITQAYVDETAANRSLTNITANPINPNGVEQVGADYVVSHYMSTDKKTWYRKWASGWIEQGGQLEKGTEKGNKTYQFPIAFTNKDSIRFSSSKREEFKQELGRYNYTANSGFFINVTETQFESGWINWHPTDWEAKGF